jgi:hypothetical protein
MSIAFSCMCGKPLKARSEFAGRKIRCPGCQQILTIPQHSSGDPSATYALEPEDLQTAEDTSRPQPLPVIPPEPKAPDPSRPTERPLVVGDDRKAVRPAPDPWVDRSLEQTITPWLGDDEERFRYRASPRRRSATWVIIVIVLLLVGVVALGYFLLQ